MRLLYTTLLLICFAVTYGQGTITNIEVLPANPTSSDSVFLVGHFSFTSGSCDKQWFTASVSGSDIIASAHYCVGALTVICNASDTINLGTLAPGNYTVDLTLSSGAAPAPCSPGIVPDDNDTMSFEVSAITAIEERVITFNVSPNPGNDIIRISAERMKTFQNESVSIYSYHGQLVYQTTVSETLEIDVSNLDPGMYLIRVGRLVKKVAIQR